MNPATLSKVFVALQSSDNFGVAFSVFSGTISCNGFWTYFKSPCKFQILSYRTALLVKVKIHLSIRKKKEVNFHFFRPLFSKMLGTCQWCML